MLLKCVSILWWKLLIPTIILWELFILWMIEIWTSLKMLHDPGASIIWCTLDLCVTGLVFDSMFLCVFSLNVSLFQQNIGILAWICQTCSRLPGYVTWFLFDWCIFCVLQRTGTVHWVCQRCTRPSVSSPRPTRTPWPSSSSIYLGNKPLPPPSTHTLTIPLTPNLSLPHPYPTPLNILPSLKL